jgi:AcrR family transcriptional regulator
MTRPSEITRERILKAAERLFAERGYEATSVRAIVAKARVNQAAINYHFAGKDGLYREVLRAAFRALTEHQLGHAEEAKAMSREKALAEFVRDQLRPLLARDEISRHIRIFNWEAVRPTAVFRKLVSEEAAPFMGLAIDLVRRFLPEADQRTLMVAAVWLIGQCSIFVRNREQLANPPASLALDEAAVERLAGLVSRLGRRRPGAAGVKPVLSQEIPGVAAKIPCSRPSAAYNACLKFNRSFEKCRAEDDRGHAIQFAVAGALPHQARSRRIAGGAGERHRRLPLHPFPIGPRARAGRRRAGCPGFDRNDAASPRRARLDPEFPQSGTGKREKAARCATARAVAAAEVGDIEPAAAMAAPRQAVAMVAAKPVAPHSKTPVIAAPLPPLVIAQAQQTESVRPAAANPDSILAKTIGIKDHVVAATHRVVSAIGGIPSWIGSIGDRIGGEGANPRPPADLVSAS